MDSSRTPKISKLSGEQERRLISYLEDQFVLLSQLHNQRDEPEAKLHDLTSLLDFILPLLSMILQTPPASNGLRYSFFLRLTIELFDLVTSYRILVSSRHREHPLHHSSHPTDGPDLNRDVPLHELLDTLNLFDEGWLAILNSESWDIRARKGIPRHSDLGSTTSISETDKTVLHSTLIQGEQVIEDWLVENEADLASEMRERFRESLWRTLELLEGVEEGVEGLESIRRGVNDLDLDTALNDIDADPGIFHGFDELDL